MAPKQTRRKFLGQTGTAAGVAMMAGLTLPQLLTACREAADARRAGAPFKALTAAEAIEFEAITAVIVPTTDTPGAHEAGVIHFIDNVLAGSRRDMLARLRDGLADLQARAGRHTAGIDQFARLGEQAQIEVFGQIEGTGFFWDIRLLTLAGMFADPSLGGNRDGIGWELLGFPGHFSSQPPFGYYDEHYADDTDG